MSAKFVVAIATFAFLTSCQAPLRLETARALRAIEIDVQFGASGQPIEFEYRAKVDEVPQRVREAMRELYPNAVVSAAEYDQHPGYVLWELIGQLDGRTLKVMFRPDGTVFMVESEIALADAPAAVAAIERGWPASRIHEALRVMDATQRHTGYQIKFQHDGRLLKAGLDVDGRVHWVVQQIAATVEVPVAIEG